MPRNKIVKRVISSRETRNMSEVHQANLGDFKVVSTLLQADADGEISDVVTHAVCFDGRVIGNFGNEEIQNLQDLLAALPYREE